MFQDGCEQVSDRDERRAEIVNRLDIRTGMRVHGLVIRVRPWRVGHYHTPRCKRGTE